MPLLRPAWERSQFYMAVALFALCLCVFGRIVMHDFVLWDDAHTIAQNKSFYPPTVESVLAYWNPFNPQAALWVPLTYTVWGLLAALAQLQTSDGFWYPINPLVFHGASVLVHAVNAVLVFALLRRLVNHDWAAWLGAAVWAVHPVQVEVVGWASGLKDLLCWGFALATLNLLLVTRDLDGDRWTWRYWSGAALIVVAMLCKPSGMVIPAVSVAVLWLIRGQPLVATLRYLWPWFIAAVPLAIVARLVQRGQGIPHVAWPLRPLVVGDSLAFYIKSIIWPFDLHLIYGRTPPFIMEQGYIWWTWTIPAALLVVLLLTRRRTRPLLGAAAIFVLGTAPTLGLVTFSYMWFSTVADHYIYLSMLGVGLTVAWTLNRGWASPRRGALVAVSALLVVGLSVLSIAQARHWQDTPSLMLHQMAGNPASPVAYNNLGSYRLREQRFEEAIDLFNSAIARDPFAQPGTYDMLAEALIAVGRREEAIAAIEKSILTPPLLPPDIPVPKPNPEALRLLAQYLADNRGEFARARPLVVRALELDPQNAESRALLERIDARLAGDSATRPADSATPPPPTPGDPG